ncbi:ABC transporter permease, partial [Francisella tularensis subsp. holarctica]|nr:ABC transporter permease [Francisella tularensis subsp. holarctica]
VIVTILVACFVVPWFNTDNYFSHIDIYSKLRHHLLSISLAQMLIGRDVIVRELLGGQISFDVAIVATIV